MLASGILLNSRRLRRNRVSPASIFDAYASGAQLRMLQRRIKQWRAEKAKDLILGQLRRSLREREETTT